MNILIPKGTNYLFTGYFSNISGNDLQGSNSKHNAGDGELILDIGTVFKIDRKQMTIDKYGKEKTIYDVHVVSISDWAKKIIYTGRKTCFFGQAYSPNEMGRFWTALLDRNTQGVKQYNTESKKIIMERNYKQMLKSTWQTKNRCYNKK